MYVRKFEADTIDQALKEIKQDLGPDAIILKTITNKGLKGAFKKKKIEITAAISEKNYTKKIKVDHVLDDSQKSDFYSGRSSYISSMINEHDQHSGDNASSAVKTSYGALGLNRPVQTIKAQKTETGMALDDFLSQGASGAGLATVAEDPVEPRVDRHIQAPINNPKPQYSETQNNSLVYDERYLEQRDKIDHLEAQIFEMKKALENVTKKGPMGIYQLRTTLKSLDINESYIQKIIKDSMYELSEDQLENLETVFEYALHRMMEEVETQMPMFSKIDANKNSFITVLLSETSCGQTSMMLKLGALKANSVLITNDIAASETSMFAKRMFDIEIIPATSIGEIVAKCRSAEEKNKSVFIDYRSHDGENENTKKFIEGLRRSFENVEVFVTLCAIHSELYNKKVALKYKSIADGIVVSKLDLCLNFGALFNIAQEMEGLPYKFFGNGEVVPDDIEAATAERILSGMFQLN
ncbi:MAG: hypothetical protein ISR65_01370 [Bacteriovoracaceae bacterium]|nr:hypothetical protein [Bacteriovoracaceae bacterium]